MESERSKGLQDFPEQAQNAKRGNTTNVRDVSHCQETIRSILFYESSLIFYPLVIIGNKDRPFNQYRQSFTQNKVVQQTNDRQPNTSHQSYKKYTFGDNNNRTSIHPPKEIINIEAFLFPDPFRARIQSCVYNRLSNQLMNKSKQIQEEYSNLKSKVQGRIKQLQSKLIPHPSPNKNRIPLVQVPHAHQHHHHCHHHCQGNYCNSQLQSPNHLSISHIDHVTSQMQSLRQINGKNHSVNQLISEALAESLKNQKQINENIRAINEKIENLSAQHNRSNLSEVFSESVRKPKKLAFARGEKILSEERKRCHSELKSQEPKDQNCTETKRYQVVNKKIKNKLKSSNSTSKLFEASAKKKLNKSNKSGTKVVSEYFLSFGCPLHSPTKISLKSIQKKEIYKDSQHRNRKHQKNHLIQSFKQQQRSRKRLISKISQNAFSQYGKK